jgi:hypothetical protein
MSVKVTLEFPEAAPAAPKPAKTDKSASAAPTAPLAAVPATPPIESPAPATSAAAPAPSYEPVKTAIVARAKEDAAKVGNVLKEFGAKTGKDLKPEQYADFLAKLEAAFAAAPDLA